MKEYLIRQIKEIEKDLKNKDSVIKFYIQDQTINLKDRWFVFNEYCSKLNKGHKPSFIHFENKNFETWFDKLTEERDIYKYETVIINNLIERYLDDLSDEFDIYIDNDTTLEEVPKLQDVINLKEQCLKEFIYSFKFDR